MKIIKGNQPVTITAVAVLAFVFAALGFFYGVLALVAYAIFVEKDKFLIKQTLTALWLNLVLTVFTRAIDFSFNAIIGNLYNQGRYAPNFLINGLTGISNTIIPVIIIVFAILAIINILKGKDAGVLFFSDLSDWAMGVEKQKPIYNYQPQEGNWICPVCGRENDHNFCATCGKEKIKN